MGNKHYSKLERIYRRNMMNNIGYSFLCTTVIVAFIILVYTVDIKHKFDEEYIATITNVGEPRTVFYEVLNTAQPVEFTKENGETVVLDIYYPNNGNYTVGDTYKLKVHRSILNTLQNKVDIVPVDNNGDDKDI